MTSVSLLKIIERFQQDIISAGGKVVEIHLDQSAITKLAKDGGLDNDPALIKTIEFSNTTNGKIQIVNVDAPLLETAETRLEFIKNTFEMNEDEIKEILKKY